MKKRLSKKIKMLESFEEKKMALFNEIREIVGEQLEFDESEIKPVPPVIMAFVGKNLR